MSRPRQPSTARPAVSVVVPFFDSEPYIAACLESLVGQEGVDDRYEILCVDNGSSDRSAEIATGVRFEMGVHGPIKEHYRLEGKNLPLPVDYIVAATGG